VRSKRTPGISAGVLPAAIIRNFSQFLSRTTRRPRASALAYDSSLTRALKRGRHEPAIWRRGMKNVSGIWQPPTPYVNPRRETDVCSRSYLGEIRGASGHIALPLCAALPASAISAPFIRQVLAAQTRLAIKPESEYAGEQCGWQKCHAGRSLHRTFAFADRCSAS